ncbi:Slp family lipoprotein [Thiohalorhabdus methylotrophus]|uniref:Slp family lipoprotein n=1 Tax=Thiohalorhabdus methylotrophus TaxID=3242694 RepID=A0ABV4TYJ0_9GAMM
MHVLRALSAALFPLFLAACATNIPEPIREPETGGPSLAEVRSDPEAHRGARVRWGGRIVQVGNNPETTSIQVVGKPLETDGRPEEGDTSEGRFIARIEGFLDPAVYSPGRLITITGSFEKIVKRKIEEYEYRFPLVDTAGHYLWAKEEPQTRRRYHDPWYDPWPWYYDPWYPYRSPYYPYW